MDWIRQVERYEPVNRQEQLDREIILEYARAFPNTVLMRENRIAHITSSGFVVNKSLSKVLMVHHNIYKTWTWTGGHADGDGDLLGVALREAREETGLEAVEPLSAGIASLDILTVCRHEKRGDYVSPHLHLSAAYVLVADESSPVRARPEENSGVQWIPVEEIPRHSGEPDLIVVYQKLLRRAQQWSEGCAHTIASARS